jgi:hypothetical protein
MQSGSESSVSWNEGRERKSESTYVPEDPRGAWIRIGFGVEEPQVFQKQMLLLISRTQESK